MYVFITIGASRLFALPTSAVLKDVSTGNDITTRVSADDVFAKECNDTGVLISGWIGREVVETR